LTADDVSCGYEQVKPAGDIQQEPQKPPSSASGQFSCVFYKCY